MRNIDLHKMNSAVEIPAIMHDNKHSERQIQDLNLRS